MDTTPRTSDLVNIFMADDCPGNRTLIKCALEDLFDEFTASKTTLYSQKPLVNYQGTLEGHKYSVVVAEDGRLSYDILINQGHASFFDLNILDNDMPGYSGLEIITTLKERKLDFPGKNILFTSNDCPLLKAKLLASGGAYYTKPTDLADFNDVVHFLVGITPHYVAKSREGNC